MCSLLARTRQVVECAQPPVQPADDGVVHEGTVLSTINEIAPLQPGRYVVRLSRPADNPAARAWTWDPSCRSAIASTVPLQSGTLRPDRVLDRGEMFRSGTLAQG